MSKKRKTSRKASRPARRRTSRKVIRRTSRKGTRKSAATAGRKTSAGSRDGLCAKPPGSYGGELASRSKAIARGKSLLAKWGIRNYDVKFSAPNNRRGAVGWCNFRERTIYLSSFFWPRISDAQRNETLIHEVAHAVVIDKQDYLGHGSVWKSQMKRMGVSRPTAKASGINSAGLSTSRNMVSICCCGNTGDMSLKKVHNFMYRYRGLCYCGGGTDQMKFYDEASRKKYQQYVRSLGSYGSVRRNPVKICGME